MAQLCMHTLCAHLQKACLPPAAVQAFMASPPWLPAACPAGELRQCTLLEELTLEHNR